VNLSDLNKFEPEKVNNEILDLPSIYIKNVPKISQRILDHPHTSRICSPTSCSMLAGYFNKKCIDSIAFSYTVFDPKLDTYGNWPLNTAALYNTCHQKISCFTQRLHSFAKLHQKLLSNTPVIVSVRGALKGALQPYNKGHLMLVFGWKKKEKKVICHDPAFY